MEYDFISQQFYFRVELGLYAWYSNHTASWRWEELKELGKRLRVLRESVGLSQAKLAQEIGSNQSSINRYENGQAAPTIELLRKYADYFDVSMDYIFARCDDPRGKLYENKIMKQRDAPELRDFIEMCFEPGSPMNERLKESLFQMMTEGKKWKLWFIQQGILTKSTKTRLEELEAAKEDLEIKIANEKIAKPRISPEFVTFWLHKFRKLDVRQQSHRKMLIDAFVNAIYLYDDKLVLTFNYKDGTRTITLDDVKDAVKNNTGSDLDCLGAPKLNRSESDFRAVFHSFLNILSANSEYIWLKS